MPIRDRLLNKIVSAGKFIETSISGIGEKTRVFTVSLSNIKCRITRNRNYGNQAIGEFISKSSHVIFMNHRTDLYTGMYIRDGNDLYEINYVDDLPGGTTNHVQVYCTNRENVT